MHKTILITMAVLAASIAGCCYMGGGGGGGGGGSWTLAPGFMPDPQTSTGSAGGATEASSWSADCRGYVPASPQHTLTASGAFPNLRVVVNGGSADLTIVVRRPDGTFMCNDDFEGLNPGVEGPFAPGAYQIFVGTYSQEIGNPSYRIGVSELGSTTPSTIGAP